MSLEEPKNQYEGKSRRDGTIVKGYLIGEDPLTYIIPADEILPKISHSMAADRVAVWVVRVEEASVRKI